MEVNSRQKTLINDEIRFISLERMEVWKVIWEIKGKVLEWRNHD